MNCHAVPSGGASSDSIVKPMLLKMSAMKTIRTRVPLPVKKRRFSSLGMEEEEDEDEEEEGEEGEKGGGGGGGGGSR